MPIAPKIKKVGGVRVTAAVHRLVASGNAARDRHDWSEAAAAYEKAVQGAPYLGPIWIQLGHALKEQGKLDQAHDAYAQASLFPRSASDAFLHLGHVCKLRHDLPAAARNYFEAVQRDASSADAASELYQVIGRARGEERRAMLALLRQLPIYSGKPPKQSGVAHAASRLMRRVMMGQSNPPDSPAPTAVPHENPGATVKAGTALVFDVSDLMGFFGHSRLPTGIQRVQIEAVSGALGLEHHDVHVCLFNEAQDAWFEIPQSHFSRLARLALASGNRNDPVWLDALSGMHREVLVADPFRFPEGAYLINPGTSWGTQNYFLCIRDAKARYDIHYIPLAFDMVPVVMPGAHTELLTRNFIAWLVGVFAHADAFMSISESTKQDVLAVGATLGHRVDPDRIAVIPLDADFRKPGLRPLGRETLAGWKLEGAAFVLMVSTVEPRKGHLTAFAAWQRLLAEHGAAKTPKLVCVGNNGWLNGEIYQRLGEDASLAAHVIMLSRLSDDELALLYQSCLFTIYPSFYEGWGLPVTESLCYGKPVIAANSSSLPEAGGRFAVYFEPGNAGQLATAAARMTFDTAWRQSLETEITSSFRPRSWQDVARQVVTEFERLSATGHAAERGVPDAPLGRYVTITSVDATVIQPTLTSGEVFRIGLGWLWPESWGCWTRPEGGELLIGLPQNAGRLEITLDLRNIPSEPSKWSLEIDGSDTITGCLAPGERTRVTCPVPTTAVTELRLRLRGDASEPLSLKSGTKEYDDHAAVGVAGFSLQPQAVHPTCSQMAALMPLAAAPHDPVIAPPQGVPGCG